MTILCMSFLWIFAFVAIKVRKKIMVKVDKEINSQHFQFLSSMIDLVGMHGTMFLFAFNSLVGALFIIIFLPETKGKSFDEIVDLLER